MASRKRLKDIDLGIKRLNANQEWIKEVSDYEDMGVILVITGAGVDGSFKIMGSNDNVSYSDIDMDAVAVAGASIQNFNLSGYGFSYLKIYFTKAGVSDGYCTPSLSAKGTV